MVEQLPMKKQNKPKKREERVNIPEMEFVLLYRNGGFEIVDLDEYCHGISPVETENNNRIKKQVFSDLIERHGADSLRYCRVVPTNITRNIHIEGID